VARKDNDSRSALAISICAGVGNTYFIPFSNVSGFIALTFVSDSKSASPTRRKVQSSQANGGCAPSGTRRVHPVIVGCSSANASPRRNCANFGHHKPLFASADRTFAIQFIAPARPEKELTV
jgi:hypothetical protein